MNTIKNFNLNTCKEVDLSLDKVVNNYYYAGCGWAQKLEDETLKKVMRSLYTYFNARNLKLYAIKKDGANSFIFFEKKGVKNYYVVGFNYEMACEGSLQFSGSIMESDIAVKENVKLDKFNY